MTLAALAIELRDLADATPDPDPSSPALPPTTPPPERPGVLARIHAELLALAREPAPC